MKLLSRPDFRRLVIGQTVSALGDWTVTIAFMVLVLHLTDSSMAVAGVLVLRLVPAAVGGAVAARATRHWNRRRTMLAMDLSRAVAVLFVPLVHAVWWIYLWAFILEILGLVFLPARDALVPDLVEADDLATADGIVVLSSYGTIPFGAAVFAALAPVSPVDRHFPLLAVFVVDAATFLVSFAFIRRVRLGQEDRPSPASESGEPLRLRHAFRIPLIRAVLPATIVISLGLGTLFSLGVVFVRDVLGAGDAEFGALIAVFGLGAGLGLTLLARLHERTAVVTVRWGTAVQGVTIASMSLAPSLAPAFAGAACFGAATAVTLASSMRTLQNELAGPQRVLAFAAFHSILRGGLALAAVTAGAAADLIGERDFPIVGVVPAARLVLLAAGAVVVLGSSMVHLPQEAHDASLDRR